MSRYKKHPWMSFEKNPNFQSSTTRFLYVIDFWELKKMYNRGEILNYASNEYMTYSELFFENVMRPIVEEFFHPNDQRFKQFLKVLSNAIITGMFERLVYKNEESFEAAIQDEVKKRVAIELEKEKSDKLLLNILPRSTAKELKSTGKAVPRYYNDVSVMFIDFKNFSGKSQQMDYRDLVLLIDEYFKAFDDIIEKYNVEKIKTIGDAYLCVSGMPIEIDNSADQLVSSALDIQRYIEKTKEIKIKGDHQYFEARIGIHTGPVVSGVVGNKKFAFDIWGDTVNIAARMESSSEIGRISISESTYQKIKDKFDCHHRGKIPAKNIGELDMYFVIDKKQ